MKKRPFQLTFSLGVLLYGPMAHAGPANNKCAPVIEYATFQPSDIGFIGSRSPQAFHRLQDPLAGGLLTAGFDGSATLVGPREEGTYSARVAVDFLEADTSVEVRVIDSDGAELNLVRLHAAEPGGWSGSLADLPARQSGRVEFSVKRGRALGTAYRVGGEFVTTTPILGRAISSMKRGTAAFSLKRPEGREPLTTGSSHYTSNYAWPGTSFSFVVDNGPVNTCGDLWTLRNNSWQVAYGWLCTDGSGYGVKGPWNVTTSFPGQDQRDYPSYIQWPNQTTTDETWHIIDVTPPTINPSLFVQGPCKSLNQSYCWVAGYVSDGQFGSGFDNTWSQVDLGFRIEDYGYWFDGSDYNTLWALVYEETGALVTYGGTVWNTRWETTKNPKAACPVGYTCTATVRVYDIWSSTTVSNIPLP